MSSFNRFPPRAFTQWETIAEIIDARFPFWKIANDAFFTTEGKQYEPDNGENWILIPFCWVEGAGTRRPYAAGDSDLEVPLLVLLGYGGAQSSVNVFAIRAAGLSSGTGFVPSGGGQGDVSIYLSVSAEGVSESRGNCSALIPFVEVAGTQRAGAAIQLIPIRVNGYGQSGNNGVATVIVPCVEVFGVASAIQYGGSTLMVPLLDVSGIGSRQSSVVTGNGNLVIPVVRLVGWSFFAATYDEQDATLRYSRTRRHI